MFDDPHTPPRLTPANITSSSPLSRKFLRRSDVSLVLNPMPAIADAEPEGLSEGRSESPSMRSTRSGLRRDAPRPKPKTAAEKKAEAAEKKKASEAAKKQQKLDEKRATMDGEASGSKLSAKARKAAEKVAKAAEKATKDAEKAAKQSKSKKRGRTDTTSGGSPCESLSHSASVSLFLNLLQSST